MARTHLPLRRTIPAGIAAYAVGYLLTLGVTISHSKTVTALEVSGRYLDATTLTQVFSSTPPPWVIAGWLFYNAHFVPTSLPTADALNGFETLTNRSHLTAVGGPLLILYLLPALLLVSAGYVVVKTGPTSGANGERNAGASIALGYVPLFLIGAFIFTSSAANAPVTASPAGIPAVFLGLVYPLVFGAIGGILAKHRTEHGRDALNRKTEDELNKW